MLQRFHLSSSRLGLGFLVLIAAVLTSASTRFVVPPSDAAITKLITQALAVEQSGIARPRGHGPIAASSIQAMRSRLGLELGQYFVGDQLTGLTSTMQGNISAQADGSVEYLGGGVDDLVMKSIVVSGTAATAVASGSVWARVSAPGSPGAAPVVAQPRQDETMTFTLVDVGSRWLISDEEDTFENGAP